MKRWKKISLSVLALIVLAQLPFVYRRFRLSRLHTAIQQLNASHPTPKNDGEFREYKGVIHVHSFLGGHSTGTFAAILEGAKANQLDFVIMTEHPSPNFDTAALTLKGEIAGVLFINGNEVLTSDQERLLLLPGSEAAAAAGSISTPQTIAEQKSRGGVALVAYPQEFKDWNAPGYDGIEVYNVFTNARQINPVVTFFDGLWSYRLYPDLMFANFYQRPAANLKAWDDAMLTMNRRLVATAGNDAHANIGFSLTDSSGKTLLGMQLDPYERSFKLVRMHVLIPTGQTLSTETLLAALRSGHCFIGFDLFGDTSGFRFTANEGAYRKIQGDELNLTRSVHLLANTSTTSRMVLFKNGNPIKEQQGQTEFDFEISELGVYRVEAYLSQLPKPFSEEPWIISNPIFVR